MASNLPRFIKLTFDQGTGDYFFYMAMYRGEAHGVVSIDGDDELNAYTKIEVEPSLINRDYVHLRFTQTNKYLGRNEDGLLAARNTMPVEDTTLPYSTLFHPSTPDKDGFFNLTHVHTGHLVRVEADQTRFAIRDPPSSPLMLRVVDWEAIVKLPSDGFIAFKGDNGKYLQTFLKDGQRYLQFSSDDANVPSAAFSVDPLSNGELKMKLPNSSNRWAPRPNWVWIIESTGAGEWFKPVKVGDSSIALFSTEAKLFCSRASGEGLTDCLSANVATIPSTAILTVQELVLERSIYSLEYDLASRRIFDEQPYIAGETVVTNDSSEEAVMPVEITYQDERSYTLTRTTSLTGGVSATVEGKIPFIENGTITVSVDISGALEWSNTYTITAPVTASGSVVVPARSSVVVSYVGTKATCNVPFSYTQQDKSSYDGGITHIRKDDGSYTGVNCYNFDFKKDEGRTLKLPN